MDGETYKFFTKKKPRKVSEFLTIYGYIGPLSGTLSWQRGLHKEKKSRYDLDTAYHRSFEIGPRNRSVYFLPCFKNKTWRNLVDFFCAPPNLALLASPESRRSSIQRCQNCNAVNKPKFEPFCIENHSRAGKGTGRFYFFLLLFSRRWDLVKGPSKVNKINSLRMLNFHSPFRFHFWRSLKRREFYK